ncbi:MAG: hypothetical protein ACRD1D_07950 [Acidimicrobiales bacterium]
MSLSGVHQTWAWVVIVGNGVAGLWALAAARWPQFRVPALWWFTAAAQISIFVEVGLGAAMVRGREVEDLQFHMFYGFLAIVAVGILYSYRQQLRDRIYLLYGAGGLFVMGLALRALELGPR